MFVNAMMKLMERSQSVFWSVAGMAAVALCFFFPAAGRGAEKLQFTRFADGKPDVAADELFTNRRIPGIRIEIPPEGLEVLRQYNGRPDQESEPRTDVRATVREGNTIYTNVAVHLKGSLGSFRPIDSDKPALTLNFDKFADGQRFHGLQKIHLNNSVQDPSYASEQISRELFLQAGIPTPRAAHALVEVNGRPQQLYVLVEGWNKQFLKRYFKNPKGNLYGPGTARDIASELDISSGDRREDRSRLDALAAAATNRTDEFETILDADRFLTFLALEVLMAHWDGYAMNRNNYRVYHDLASDRLVFLPHGLDQMFGVWRMSPTSPITPMMKAIVAKAMIQAPHGRQRYLDRMSDLVTNLFKVDVITNRVNEIAAGISAALARDPAALANQQRALNALNLRIALRVQSVTDQLKEANTPLKFDASGSAKLALAAWRSSRESGSPSFSRMRGPQETLQVSASGSYAYGSWRTLVLLDQGDYQFVGKIRTQDLQFDQRVTRGGATLRLSGERLSTMLTNAVQWTDFAYDFTVPGLADLELVCEFRGSSGRAWFDLNSLKIIRRTEAQRK
jgi:spore coat protein H